MLLVDLILVLALTFFSVDSHLFSGAGVFLGNATFPLLKILIPAFEILSSYFFFQFVFAEGKVFHFGNDCFISSNPFVCIS